MKTEEMRQVLRVQLVEHARQAATQGRYAAEWMAPPYVVANPPGAAESCAIRAAHSGRIALALRAVMRMLRGSDRC